MDNHPLFILLPSKLESSCADLYTVVEYIQYIFLLFILLYGRCIRLYTQTLHLHTHNIPLANKYFEKREPAAHLLFQ